MHYPVATDDSPCPDQKPSYTESRWQRIDVPQLEVNNTAWGITYSGSNEILAIKDSDGESDSEVAITMKRSGDQMMAGGLYTNADIARGGAYSVSCLWIRPASAFCCHT